MDVVTILKIVSIILGVIVTSVIPLIFRLVSAIKAKKNATTEAEKEAAKNDMMTVVHSLIESAEQLYFNIDAVLKQQNSSCGAMKKESVMAKLQAYAIEKGYTFDADFWSAQIDNIVSLTKKVNAK